MHTYRFSGPIAHLGGLGVSPERILLRVRRPSICIYICTYMMGMRYAVIAWICQIVPWPCTHGSEITHHRHKTIELYTKQLLPNPRDISTYICRYPFLPEYEVAQEMDGCDGCELRRGQVGVVVHEVAGLIASMVALGSHNAIHT
jgi:hypothetical protein